MPLRLRMCMLCWPFSCTRKQAWQPAGAPFAPCAPHHGHFEGAAVQLVQVALGVHLPQNRSRGLVRLHQLPWRQHAARLQKRQHVLELLAVKRVQPLQAPEPNVVGWRVADGQL